MGLNRSFYLLGLFEMMRSPQFKIKPIHHTSWIDLIQYGSIKTTATTSMGAAFNRQLGNLIFRKGTKSCLAGRAGVAIHRDADGSHPGIGFHGFECQGCGGILVKVSLTVRTGMDIIVNLGVTT
jgi:hypothetical protein